MPSAIKRGMYIDNNGLGYTPAMYHMTHFLRSTMYIYDNRLLALYPGEVQLKTGYEDNDEYDDDA